MSTSPACWRGRIRKWLGNKKAFDYTNDCIIKILQMNIAYSQPKGGQPIGEVFDREEIKVLRLMNKKLQGKTKKLQNHHDPEGTKWAAWVIGRIGGWKGYDSQGPPGVIALKRGLDRLNYMIEGIKLVKVGTR